MKVDIRCTDVLEYNGEKTSIFGLTWFFSDIS